VSGGFAAQHNIEIGDRLRVQHGGEDDTERTYRVVAILTESNQLGGGDIYLPVTLLDEQRYTQVQILTESASQAEATAELLRTEFNGREDKLLVFELTGLLRLFNQIVTGINTFLLGVGTIAMVIAGVSIANTMLMTVMQRREEIGVLRAVGYQRLDILRILLLETTMLGVAGGVAGIALALPVVMVANQIFLQNPFAFSQTAIGYFVLAFGFGVAISLLAGLYPAWRAANERPVDALRG
jgi:putative ABC transport system permease protein